MTPRSPVVRAERIKPTAQTVAKAKPCLIKTLYEANTIDGYEQEAAWEILEAFTIMTGFLGYRPLILDGLPKGRGGLSERGDRLWRRYVAWGNTLVKNRHIRPIVVVEWLEMERVLKCMDETKLLRSALRDWNVIDFPQKVGY
jgi:hypothetical protein